MSWTSALEPVCPDDISLESVETLIVPRVRDLGGFEVRRTLPAGRRLMVGPFIFFDQMGPAGFEPGKGIDVRPHPHIGLATVTYLFKGEIQHRDSLGSNQLIRPGEVNWMIAGRGITHSERTGTAERARPHELSGIQTWVALPERDEETEPGFEHQPREALPYFEGEGKRFRLILGAAYGERAPVSTFSEMFYLDAALDPGASIPLPDDFEERAAYILEGSVKVAGENYEAGRMLVFRTGDRVSLTAGESGARLMLLGGEALEGPRYIWWNFVASSKDKIEAAKEAWRSGDFTGGRFSLPVGDQDEFIPLP
ncbi:MAG: pirin family protein, partial [Arenicellales bacterium]